MHTHTPPLLLKIRLLSSSLLLVIPQATSWLTLQNGELTVRKTSMNLSGWLAGCSELKINCLE